MTIIKSDIIIIGAGLTGLCLAYLLKQKGIDALIIEARDRLGGRIYTKYDGQDKALEMGATWLGRKHDVLIELLKDLDIGIFEQELGTTAYYEPISTSPPQLVKLPPNNDPSFRIQGGSSSVINALAKRLDEGQIYLNQLAVSIQDQEKGIIVETASHQFHGKKIISTLPPCLLIKSINIIPTLPFSIYELARTTHTWMGESIKIGLTYKQAFWKRNQSSGTIFSSVGPIPEMYDHSNYEKSYFALKGFLNGAYYSISKEERLQLILKQLEKYFGNQVHDYTSYDEMVWRKEELTFVDYDSHILPHQNNGHPLFQKAYLNGKLFIAGSETSSSYPGYMDGAVRSALFIAEKIAIST